MEGVTLAGSWRVYSGSAPDPASPSAGHILLHPHRPRWLVLNGTGLEIARRIAQGASVDQIAAALDFY